MVAEDLHYLAEAAPFVIEPPFGGPSQEVKRSPSNVLMSPAVNQRKPSDVCAIAYALLPEPSRVRQEVCMYWVTRLLGSRA